MSPTETTASVAIVTGSASGIGRAIAIRLAEDGYDVALFDLPSGEDKLQEVANEINVSTGRRTLAITGDVSMEEDVRSLIERVTEAWGGLDVVSSLFFNLVLYQSVSPNVQSVDDFQCRYCDAEAN